MIERQPATEQSSVLSGRTLKDLAIDLRRGGSEAERARTAILGLGDAALAQLLESATTDIKTDLSNQATLEDDILDLLAHPEQSGIMITTDLVGFKAVNDALGQSFGDKIMRLAAKGMTAAVRTRRTNSADSLYLLSPKNVPTIDGDSYRIGGDEFVALLRNGESLRAAPHELIVRRKIVSMISYRPLVEELENNAINDFGVRASFVSVEPDTFTSFDDLLRVADPKKHKVCEYRLVCDDEGFLFPAKVV